MHDIWTLLHLLDEAGEFKQGSKKTLWQAKQVQKKLKDFGVLRAK